MKVYTNIEYVWDDKQNKLVETSSESHDYEGRVDRADIAPYDWENLSAFGGDMGVYNYWLNLLPPDVLQEMMGIFSDPMIGTYAPSQSEDYAPWYQDYSGETAMDYSQATPGGVPSSYTQPQWAEDIGDWYNPFSYIGGGQDNPEDYSFNFLPFVDIMNPSAIGVGLTEQADIDESEFAITPQTALTPDLIKSLRSSYYRPFVEAGRGELIDKFTPEFGKAKRLGSGLAGYGGRDRALGQQYSSFGAGMGQVFGNVDAQRGQARSRIGDIMGQWREALESA